MTFVPIDLKQVATIVSTRGMFQDAALEWERLVFEDWSPKSFEGVPFHLVDPHGDTTPNVILLYGPDGAIPPKMPRSVRLPCNLPARTIHFLSGVSGWGFPETPAGSVSLVVRLHFADGATEDHELKNGVHFANYVGVVFEVPESKLAFKLRGNQLRYLAIHPQRPDAIAEIELVKGNDRTAPVVMAVTVESP